MRNRSLVLTFAGLHPFQAGGRSHIHAGGPNGFGTGTTMDPRHTHTPPVVIGPPTPVPDVVPPK